MPTYLTPGIFVEEKKSGARPIEGVSTSVAAFLGVTAKGPVNKATLITSFAEFVRRFGGPVPIIAGSQEHYLYYAVRHFFTEGGTKCFVVRVVHYTDVNDSATSAAVRAFKDINGFQVDQTTAVAAALRISAINEGKWGESLSVQVENSSKFFLNLAGTITGSPTLTQFNLKDNLDVQTGSLLHIVEQVTGTVREVDELTQTIKIMPGLTNEPAAFNSTIPNGARVFSTDMRFQAKTVLGAVISVDTSVLSAAIKLTRVDNVDGIKLKAGDIVNFVTGKEALVVVKRIDSDILATGEKVMIVEVEAGGLSQTFDELHSRVYARDFTIRVKDGQEVVETHANLSYVNANKSDFVNDRLSLASGNSNFIIAREDPLTNAVIVDNQPYVRLAGGNDGISAINAGDFTGSELVGSGLRALDANKDISILVIPKAEEAVALAGIGYCGLRKDLFYIIDAPAANADPQVFVSKLVSEYAAFYYPWIMDEDPVTGKLIKVPPSGAVAGSYAFTDSTRGVHKAPAGITEGYLNSALDVDPIVPKPLHDILFQKKINVIRKLPEGIVIWGARTLAFDSAWKYLNVRRLFIFLEQSIERGMSWSVFEPNDINLWKAIEANVEAFLRIQWQEEKLVGVKEEQAFFVRCNAALNTPDTVNMGQVITEIGVSPSKPAEFVVFRIKQFAGK